MDEIATTDNASEKTEKIDRGFSKALMSTIFGFFSIVTCTLSYTLSLAGTIIDLEQTTTVPKALSALLGFITAALVIVSTVFGILSIIKFVKLKKQGIKPVATLVLGCVGLYHSLTTIITALFLVATQLIIKAAPIPLENIYI